MPVTQRLSVRKHFRWIADFEFAILAYKNFTKNFCIFNFCCHYIRFFIVCVTIYEKG